MRFYPGIKQFRFAIDAKEGCTGVEITNESSGFLRLLTLRIAFLCMPGRDTSVNIVWHKSVFRSPVTDLAEY